MMKKISKLLLIIIFCFTFLLIGCEVEPAIEDDYHNWDKVVVNEATCTENGLIRYTKGSDFREEVIDALGHDLIEEMSDPTCTEYGKKVTKCSRCGKVISYQNTASPLGHHYIYQVIEESINGSIGKKQRICEVCGMVESEYKYVNNGYSRFGKLHVEGTDLVDKDNNPVQLIGLSTHGLHWYGEYVNEVSLAACKEAFNVNLFRFSLYTSENGYCECSEKKKEELYNRVLEGVRIATKLDMYAIPNTELKNHHKYTLLKL